MINVLDHGYIKLVTSWGSEEQIIEAARMSTDGGFKGWDDVPCPNASCATTFQDQTCSQCKGKGYIPGDTRLLRYLWEHKHTTPFEMAGLTFEIQAPIFVFREWHRHRTQSYNEMSARYTVLPDLFYVPSLERMKASRQDQINKQGSGGSPFSDLEAEQRRTQIGEAYRHARSNYIDLIAMGVAKEVARLVIPVAQYSRMRASANLLNWFKFLALRLPENAQWEIRQYAEAALELAAPIFPRCVGLFKAGLK